MASCREDTAVEKFLKIPELLEKLIHLLDVNSIASLAEVQPMNQNPSEGHTLEQSDKEKLPKLESCELVQHRGGL